MARRLVREAFEKSDQVLCYYCNVVMVNTGSQDNDLFATVDHKIPRSRGGTYRRTNLVICCTRCNNRKGSLTEEEYQSVKHSTKEVKALQRQVLIELGWIDPQVKIEREKRLAERLRDPDPNCPNCHGSGKFSPKRKSHKRNKRCFCCVTGVTWQGKGHRPHDNGYNGPLLRVRDIPVQREMQEPSTPATRSHVADLTTQSMTR